VRQADGFYWIPTLPREISEKIKATPRVDWPKELELEYRRLHSDFTAAKAEFMSWVRKDRDSRMVPNAKLILNYLIDCLNFDTGRCDPSHQTIADELELGLRTVQRLIPQIAKVGWCEVVRRGKTTSNFYRLRVPCEKVHRLMDRVDYLRERRMSEPPSVAYHLASEPPFESSHDAPSVAAHEPPSMADKPLNRTSEREPLKFFKGSEGEGYTLGAPEPEFASTNAYARAKGGM
jgi:hypothetical protein